MVALMIFFFLLQQLRSNIREMEKLCLKVRKDDLGLLKRMIDPVKEEASAATAEFLQLHLESVEELKKQFNDEETFLQPSLTRSMTVGGNVLSLILDCSIVMQLIEFTSCTDIVDLKIIYKSPGIPPSSVC